MSVLDWDGLVYYDKKIKKHIKDKISEAVLSGEGTVDLSKYATKNEVDEKLSIQQAVGDAGKILKVGNDGNIEFVDGGSDSTWKGTKEEWEALSSTEKGKYEIVCFTND